MRLYTEKSLKAFRELSDNELGNMLKVSLLEIWKMVEEDEEEYEKVILLLLESHFLENEKIGE